MFYERQNVFGAFRNKKKILMSLDGYQDREFYTNWPNWTPIIKI